MSIVNLLNVLIVNNPAKFTDPYCLEITFECLEELNEDLEWKLVYVGSAESTEHDQELDALLVGPVPVGVNKFRFTADPPSPAKIPEDDILGPTVMLLTCAYDGREFVRVGYYVNNEYDIEEWRTEPPKKVQIEHVIRSILADKPRITRFNIKWDNQESAPADFPPVQAGVDDEPEETYGAEEVEDEEEDEDEDDEDDDKFTEADGGVKVIEAEDSRQKNGINDINSGEHAKIRGTGLPESSGSIDLQSAGAVAEP